MSPANPEEFLERHIAKSALTFQNAHLWQGATYIALKQRQLRIPMEDVLDWIWRSHGEKTCFEVRQELEALR